VGRGLQVPPGITEKELGDRIQGEDNNFDKEDGQNKGAQWPLEPHTHPSTLSIPQVGGKDLCANSSLIWPLGP